LSLTQLGGIGLLIVGAYFLELKPHHGFLGPLESVRDSKYIHYIFGALTLYAIAGVIERYVLGTLGFQVVAYHSFVHLFLAFNSIVMLMVFHDGFKGIKRGFGKVGWWVVLAGFLAAKTETT